MSEFVRDCRREWKRLGVPDPIANEMAADLEADLEEAAGEGVSLEEVLGSGVFDPPTFAASWASERGVIPPQPVEPVETQSTPGKRPASRTRLLVGLAASASVAVIGLALLTAHTSVARAVVSPAAGVSPFAGGPQLPRSWPPGVRATVLRANVGGAPFHTLGVVLLLLGGIGLTVLLLFWSQSRDYATRGASSA